MRSNSARNIILCVALGLISSTASADVTNTIERGWYSNAGFHSPGNDNYFAGKIGQILHNFFVLDLSGISGQIVSARLIAFNPHQGYTSSDPTENYAMFDVSTSIASLTAGTAGMAGYNDLFSGASYGNITVSAADNNTDITIELNAAGIADLNANLGGQMVIGGGLTTITGNHQQFLFGFTGGGGPQGLDGKTRLEFEVIPAPGAATLGLLGLGAVAFKRRRRG